MARNIIPNHQVIPEIESDLFVNHEESRFAVGVVAMGSSVTPGLEREHFGYGRLRANVYAYQKNYMPVNDLNPNGTETDPDDERSIHFALIENAIRGQRVVGAMRLIIKSREQSGLLPVEIHYPEAFNGMVAPIHSTEVSRLIGRHEDSSVKESLKWPLFIAGVNTVLENQLGPVFGAVEPELEESLLGSGVPVYKLAEAKYIPEFNSTKLPLRVEINELAQRIEGDRPDLMNAMRQADVTFAYSGSAIHDDKAIVA